MSTEALPIIINELRNHAQGITYEVERIANTYEHAIASQDRESFNRRLYLDEQKNLEAIIALEERLYGHAEFLRSIVGSSKLDEIADEQSRRNGKTSGGC